MDNELRHYGVMGMHWGRRKNSIYFTKKRGEQAQAAREKIKSEGGRAAVTKNWAKDRVHESAKMLKNEVKHPILSSVAAVKTIPNHKLGFATGMMSNRQIKEINANTDQLVAKSNAKKAAKAQAKAKSKADIKDAVKRYSDAFSKAYDTNDINSPEWKKVKELRKQTGKNSVSRVINTIKYTK